MAEMSSGGAGAALDFYKWEVPRNGQQICRMAFLLACAYGVDILTARRAKTEGSSGTSRLPVTGDRAFTVAGRRVMEHSAGRDKNIPVTSELLSTSQNLALQIPGHHHRTINLEVALQLRQH